MVYFILLHLARQVMLMVPVFCFHDWGGNFE